MIHVKKLVVDAQHSISCIIIITSESGKFLSALWQQKLPVSFYNVHSVQS